MTNNNNPNWQDTIFGGTILAGFALVAVVAVVFMLVSWGGDRTAGLSKANVVSSIASRPAAPSTYTN